MIYRTDIPDAAAQLANRRHALSIMADIPDMWEYANAWAKLAADFLAVGYNANAEKCNAKAMHYAAQAGPRKVSPTRYRYAFCVACDTWTQHALNVTEDAYYCACGESLEFSQQSTLAALSGEITPETANELRKEIR